MDRIKVLAILALVICFIISGCISSEREAKVGEPSAESVGTTEETQKDDDGTVTISGWGPHMFSGLYDRDYGREDRLLENVIAAVEAKDAEAIKKLFSVNAIAAAGDLDQQIAELMEFYEGELVSLDSPASANHKSHHGRIRIESTEATFELQTTEEAYRVAMSFCVTDTTDENNVGITSIYIIKEENADPEFAYWGGWVWDPGIVIQYEPVSTNTQ